MNDNGGSMQNMTLRDWFAGQALAGFCSSAEIERAMIAAADKAGVDSSVVFAEDAYAMADAMLAERIKE